MKSYAAIRAEIEKLERQAQAARSSEVAGVMAKIKEAIDMYGFTAADLGFGRGAGAKAAKRASRKQTGQSATSAGVPKYRDPQTGKTWTGRGKPPGWIAGAKDRDAFLIAPAADGDGTVSKKRRAPNKRVEQAVSAGRARKGPAGRKGAAARGKAKLGEGSPSEAEA